MYRARVKRLVLGMRGLACLVLICHQQKRTFGGWRASSRRDFASHFRLSYDILRSSRRRSSPCFQHVPTAVVVLKQPSQIIHNSREAYTFRRRFRIPYVSPWSSSPPCWRHSRRVWPSASQVQKSLMPNNYILSCTIIYCCTAVCTC